jgi:hypothetical protein
MSDNPYLPPAAETDVPDAPHSHGWMVKDDYLYVEPNAQLPMIDLFTGETADRMILHSMKVTRNPFWLISLIWTAVGLTIVSIALGNTPLVTITGPLALVSGLAAGIGATFTRSFTLKALFTHESSRKITLLSRTEAFLGIALAGLSFTLFAFPMRGTPGARMALAITLAAAIVSRIVLSFFLKKLICRRSMGSHLELRGVHPVALERLRGLRPG